MTRVIGLRVVSLLVMAALLLFPVLGGLVANGSGSGVDPVTITHYEADYAVDADGTLRATETITADFPSGRHGIFRYWDLADLADRTVRYQIGRAHV